MLSVFPELLFLSPFAPLIIRLALGATLLYATWAHLNSEDNNARRLSVPEGLAAILLVAGAWTQPAAILAALILAIHLFLPKFATTSRAARSAH